MTTQARSCLAAAADATHSAEAAAAERTAREFKIKVGVPQSWRDSIQYDSYFIPLSVWQLYI